MSVARSQLPAVAAVVAGGLCLLVVLWPGFFAVLSLLDAPVIAPELLDASALVRTLLWSLAVAVVTTPIGLLAAHCLAGVLRSGRGARLAVALCVVPLCVPGYAVFWCWWQAFGPGSTIGGVALQQGSAVLLREGVLLLALACWSWPLLAWPIALTRCHGSEAGVALAALDGATRRQRLALRWRSERWALLLGVGLVVFLTAGATISFDLAQVVTIGFELRALDATGVPPGALLRLALPSVVIAILGALLLSLLVRWSARRWQSPLALRARGSGPTGRAWCCLVLLAVVTAVLPMILAFSGIGSLDPGLFWSLHAEATVRTVLAALLDGALAALLAGALFVQVAQGGRLLRILGVVLGLLWVGVSLLPSIAVCAALTTAFNGTILGPLVYDSGGALLIGHLARSGGIAAAIALFMAWSESRSGSAARRLDPIRLRAVGPRLRATVLMAFAITAVFSLGELVIASRLAPPGDQRIATTLLNAMHYQRPDTVLFALAGLVSCGWLLAVLLAFGIPRASRSGVMALSLLLFIGLPGCDQPRDEPRVLPAEISSVPRVPAEVMVGAPGRGPGLFDFPRGLALDAKRDRFYVVDKTSRVQRFGLDGTLQASWRLPEWTVGKPVGISVAPDGRVFVPDTHYHRVIVYDPEGNELQRFGRFGTGPGEFVYPTDIAFAPDGTYYIAEYGNNDRIQVFSSDGDPLRSFGRFGREDGAFARPQSIALSSERGELYVADTCNHRIGVHALDGTWLRSLAGPGTEPGRLSYPHGLELLPDGTLLVSEIGTDRVQRLDAQSGDSLGTWGGSGFERGLLKTPWGVASDGERLLVLDSGNARVQIGSLPTTSGPTTSED